MNDVVKGLVLQKSTDEAARLWNKDNDRNCLLNKCSEKCPDVDDTVSFVCCPLEDALRHIPRDQQYSW